MKLRLMLLTVLLTLFFLSKTLFASFDHLLSTYIPVIDPQAELFDEDGIRLHKALFFTHMAEPEASISSITWSYIINTPHKRNKGTEANLAHIKGLEVSLSYAEGANAGCTVTMDSSHVVTNYKRKELKYILEYVEKATKLNMKESELNCKFKHILNQ